MVFIPFLEKNLQDSVRNEMYIAFFRAFARSAKQLQQPHMVQELHTHLTTYFCHSLLKTQRAIVRLSGEE